MQALPQGDDWSLDQATGCYRSKSEETTRTKKEQRPIVMYEATKEHPAQTQLVTEDVSVGTWSKTKFSGAVPLGTQRTWLNRIDDWIEQVKSAREAANSIDSIKEEYAEMLWSRIFTV